MFHTLIIASKGRSEILADTLTSLSRQTHQPAQVIVSLTSEEDMPSGLGSSVQVVYSDPGLTKQLNRAMGSVDPTCTMVTILDDDVELSEDYFEVVLGYFKNDPRLAGIHGKVLHDGQISREASVSLLKEEAGRQSHLKGEGSHPCERLYGCNMSIRYSFIKDYSFDENLPLYSWLFEIPLSLALGKKGTLIKIMDACLVHLRTDGSRMAEKRFGYAQIANPLYLWRQNSLKTGETFFFYILSAITSNILKIFSGRPQRAHGNLMAIWDGCMGRVSPGRIREI